MSSPIAKHDDGSDCYTVNCSRRHAPASPEVALKNNDINSFLDAKDKEASKELTPEEVDSLLKETDSNLSELSETLDPLITRQRELLSFRDELVSESYKLSTESMSNNLSFMRKIAKDQIRNTVASQKIDEWIKSHGKGKFYPAGYRDDGYYTPSVDLTLTEGEDTSDLVEPTIDLARSLDLDEDGEYTFGVMPEDYDRVGMVSVTLFGENYEHARVEGAYDGRRLEDGSVKDALDLVATRYYNVRTTSPAPDYHDYNSDINFDY